MPTSQAHVATDRPSRYLVQLCRHAAAMGGSGGHAARLRHRHGQGAPQADWSDEHGVITFGAESRCTLTAEGGILTISVEAESDEELRRIQGLLAADLARFSRRAPLTVAWTPRGSDPDPTRA